MHKIILLCFGVVGILWGCTTGSGQLSPNELFVVNSKKHLTIEQQGERLRYGRLLKPLVDGDTLRVRKTSQVPLQYYKYAEEFARLLNRYLREMDISDRKLVLSCMEGDIVENAVLGSCIRVEKGRYKLELSKTEALKIGISEKRYEEVVVDVKHVNQLLDQGGNTEIPKLGFDTSVSVFFNPSVLTMVKNEGIYSAFMNDLEQLKVMY